MKPEQGSEMQAHAAPSAPTNARDAAAGQLRLAVERAQAAFAEHSGPAAEKAGAVARVAIRTGKEVRRAVRSGAGEIGEVVAGQTGREVGQLRRDHWPWLVVLRPAAVRRRKHPARRPHGRRVTLQRARHPAAVQSIRTVIVAHLERSPLALIS